MTEPESPDAPVDAAPAETPHERAMFEGMIPRLRRSMVVASVLLLGAVFWFYRWAGCVGFALGAVISYVNFGSLARGVEGLTERIVQQNSTEKGSAIVFRFMVRYGLVGAAAYAIFKGSSLAFRGFLWGLCVPVAALMAEAVWQGYHALRRTDSGPSSNPQS